MQFGIADFMQFPLLSSSVNLFAKVKIISYFVSKDKKIIERIMAYLLVVADQTSVFVF
jgi:hypothetical protein